MSRAARWLGATRPAFLSITLLAVLLGFSHAAWRAPAPASALMVLLTLCGALLAHAAANVLNDVADADNGCDAGKRNGTVRLTPIHAALPYATLWLGASLAVIGGWWLGALPASALIALAVMPIGLFASVQIRRWALNPAQLAIPIRLTLLQAHQVGALLALGLVGDRLFRTSP